MCIEWLQAMIPEEYGSLFNFHKCTDIPLVPMWSIQAKGEECGGPWGIYGECGEGLECRQDHCPPGEQDLECYHHYLTGQPVLALNLTLLLTLPTTHVTFRPSLYLLYIWEGH